MLANMYQFVHGVSYIPEDILLLHPPSNYVHLISLFPMLEQMLINTPSSHANVLHFWNSLPATPAQAPSSSETYWIQCLGILAMLFNSWTTAVCRNFYRKNLMFVTTVQIDNIDGTKMNADFTACPWEGLIHEWTHTLLAPPLPLTPVNNSHFCSTHGACTQKVSGRWGALVSVACAG